MMTKKLPLPVLCLLVCLFTLLAATPSWALDVYMAAKQFTKTMPDGSEVVMWGFASDQDNDLSTDDGEAASSPGPMITVPPGDSVLNIHLRNDLGVPVSLVIPALSTPLTPVRFTDGQGRSRVQSFTAETAPGQVNAYSWNARPGSFIYHSGTHLPVQVPMGLYGGVKKDAQAGQVYGRSDTVYQNEVLLFYSEIDPALHAAVAAGTYGTAAYPGTIDYDPKYFLVNGQPYTAATLPMYSGRPGEMALIRFFNAGIESHSIVTQGLYMKFLSEDGNLYQFPKEQYSVFIPAGKTAEGVITPAEPGDYPVYDRRLFLVSNGVSPGGMFSVLRIASEIVAADDSYAVEQGTLLSVPAPGVCANDTSAQGASAVVVTTTQNGTLALSSDCSFTYTPDAGFSGTDSFEYQLSAQGNQSNTATVTITVTPVVQAPVANDDFFATDENTALNVAAPGVLANDIMPGPAVTAELVSNVSSGTLVLNTDGSFTYTPVAGFSGNDSFSYRIVNGTQSNIATVSITVNQAIPAPVAANDTYVTDEDAAMNMVAPGVLANDSLNGPNPRAALVTGPSYGTLALNADGSFTYTPSANYNGADSFTYMVVTDSMSSPAATVSMTVNPVNDSPVAADDSASTFANTPAVINVLANDSDAEGSALTAIVASPPQNGTVTVNADQSLTYTSNAGFAGTDTFTYSASDGSVLSAPATVTVTVSEQPQAAGDSYAINEDTTLTVAAAPGVLGNDQFTGAASAVLVTPASNGSLVLNSDGSFTYTPSTNYSGADAFTYSFTSGGIQSNAATVDITVTPVNDAPVAVYDNVSTAFNVPIVINALANDTDADVTPIVLSVLANDTVAGGDVLRIAAVTGAPANGTVVINSDNTFTYTPNAGYVGSDRFFYTASDGTVTSNAARVYVTVRANQLPVSVTDNSTTTVNTPVVVDLAANDYDPDGTIVRSTLTILTAPGRGGSVVNNGDGTVTFTPLSGFAGSDYFYYNIKDNYGATSKSAKVTVKVVK